MTFRFGISLLLFSLLWISSCAINSKNLTYRGEIALRGGTFQHQKWKESLRFERISWYQEITTIFDGLVASINSESPFFNWFSDGEKRLIKDCQDLKIGMSFYHDPKRISERMFKNEWLKAGYESIAIPEFKRNVLVHSDVNVFNLSQYSVFGLCRKGISQSDNGEVAINFPGFNTQKFLGIKK